MKKVKLILFFVFAFNSVFSQIIGTKFAPDSTYYIENGLFNQTMLPPVAFSSNKYILGDTVIGNKYYQKLYVTNNRAFDTICLGTLNLLHRDSGKVFLNNNLLYNFNLNVGDTISVFYSAFLSIPAANYNYTVTIKDSIYIGNKWRKQITLNGPTNAISGLKWVDGLGDQNYGLMPSYSQVGLCIGSGGWYKLDCFSEHFQNTFGSGCKISPICGWYNSNSSSACFNDWNKIYFNLYGGNPPFTYTVQTPSACTQITYTNIGSSSSFSFALNCNGVYTISIKDSNNRYIGIANHTSSTTQTVIQMAIIAMHDTICLGGTQGLVGGFVTPTYTVDQLQWSEGSTGSSIAVSPTVTTTYSYTGIYTAANTRTCTSVGSKEIVVVSCIGIHEYEASNDLIISPNPVNDLLSVKFQNEVKTEKCTIITTTGQQIPLASNSTEKFYVGFLSEGIYFIQITTNKGVLIRKILIQK